MRLLWLQSVYPITILLALFTTNSLTVVVANQIALDRQSSVVSDPLGIERALAKLDVHFDDLPEFDASPQNLGHKVACSSLKHLFANRTITISEPEAYHAFTESYWSSQQTELAPACIFVPSTPKQLAIQILLSRLTSTPFAVRAGGHASFAGASSINDGIAVSLELFNETTVSEGETGAVAVIVGAGNRWRDVYRALEPHGLTVVGGRDADVGVGGLLLGGGMSFFSNMRGWACDNVAAYEVVLASGDVIRASAEGEHADVYWALRGGGGNFGVVTRFWMDGYPLPQGLVWGGAAGTTDVRKFGSLFNAFYTLGTEGATTDGRASQILSLVGLGKDKYYVGVSLVYAEPVIGGETPEVLREYLDILEDARGDARGDAARTEDQTGKGHKISPSFYNRRLSEITSTFSRGQPSGKRNTYWTVTLKMRRDAFGAARDLFVEELETSDLAGVEGLFPALMMQVITAPVLRNMQKRGGNPLGLEGEEPRLLVTTVMSWDNGEDDEAVMQLNERIVARLVELAKSSGWDDRFVYMNYASKGQDVIAGYGEMNHKRLVDIARKYDPTETFQKLVPGYHNLGI